MRLSIRRRLALWNTLAMAAVLAGFAGLVYALMRHALHEQVDRTLELGLAQLRADGRLDSAPEARLRHWVEEFDEHLGLASAVYRPGGGVLAASPALTGGALASLPSPEIGEASNLGVAGLGRQRAMAGRVRAGGQEYTVLLLAPLGPVDHELAEVRAVLLTAGPFALLLSAGVAYWLARTSLAPVDRLRRGTEAITADRLDRRLPVVNPHDELGRLSQTINDMIARLERSFAEVRRFTADASHEMRTPLSVIRAEAELALQNHSDPGACRNGMCSILEECQRMTHLTDQLLTLAREDAGTFERPHAQIDLASLVAEVADALRPLAEAKGVTLAVRADGPARVRGDESRLRRVLVNVLDNAIKYTPRGEVAVGVSARGAEAVVAVRDTGQGIPPEHLPHVFERFYRVDKARSRAEGGTGLGLSIARSIVEAHGGRIGIESESGRGTTCTIILPQAKEGRS